jgi:hypothetical protein
VNHIAGPAGAGLGPKPSLAVVRGLDPVAGSTALRRLQSDLISAGLTLVWPRLLPLKVPRPHPAQHGNRGQRGDGRRCLGPVDCIKQQKAIRSDLGHIGVALGFGLGQAPVLNPPVIALVPLGWSEGPQPVRGDPSDGVQRRSQGLGQ